MVCGERLRLFLRALLWCILPHALGCVQLKQGRNAGGDEMERKKELTISGERKPTISIMGKRAEDVK